MEGIFIKNAKEDKEKKKKKRERMRIRKSKDTGIMVLSKKFLRENDN